MRRIINVMLCYVMLFIFFLSHCHHFWGLSVVLFVRLIGQRNTERKLVALRNTDEELEGGNTVDEIVVDFEDNLDKPDNLDNLDDLDELDNLDDLDNLDTVYNLDVERFLIRIPPEPSLSNPDRVV